MIEHLFEPCGGLCVGLEAVLRNRIMVKRYSYCDPDKQVRLIAQHRIRQLQENAPELLPASACAHWDSALPHDVQDISPDMLQQLPEVTLLIAGPPCQPWSAAGQQLGWEDPRAAVFKVVINLLNYMINHQSTPPRFVIENVKGASHCPTLRAALGAPTVLQAHLLGSTARRTTAIWTNMADLHSAWAHHLTLTANRFGPTVQNRLKQWNATGWSAPDPGGP